MLYPKNVPNWERAIRTIGGIILIAFALLQPLLGSLLTVVLIGSGLAAIITGFVGWCPACALVGRKIKQQQYKTGI